MPYKLVVGDRTVQCETAEDVAALLRVLGPSENGIAPANKTQAAEAHSELVPADSTRLLTFLRAVSDSGKDGITSPQLKERLGLKDARALGVMMGMLGRFIENRGIPRTHVLIRKRTADGERRWFRRKRMPEVLQALEGSVTT